MKTYLFDLDGTLLDAERRVHLAGMLSAAGERHAEVWTWAAGCLAPCGQHAGVGNRGAYLPTSELNGFGRESYQPFGAWANASRISIVERIPITWS